MKVLSAGGVLWHQVNGTRGQPVQWGENRSTNEAMGMEKKQSDLFAALKFPVNI